MRVLVILHYYERHVTKTRVTRLKHVTNLRNNQLCHIPELLNHVVILDKTTQYTVYAQRQRTRVLGTL